MTAGALPANSDGDIAAVLITLTIAVTLVIAIWLLIAWIRDGRPHHEPAPGKSMKRCGMARCTHPGSVLAVHAHGHWIWVCTAHDHEGHLRGWLLDTTPETSHP